MDLGDESYTRVLYELLRDIRPVSVVHLAFVIDPVRSGVLDPERMWQINVAGTARVMEAITEANRTTDAGIKQFRFSQQCFSLRAQPSVAGNRRVAQGGAYPALCDSQKAVRRSSAAAFFGVARMQCVHSASAYLCRGQRGKLPFRSVSRLAQRQRLAGRKNAPARAKGCLACCRAATVSRQQNPVRTRRRHGAFAGAHSAPGSGAAAVDDSECRRTRRAAYFARCIEMAQAKLVRVPSKWAMRLVLQFLWKQQISAIPPDALPYMTGEVHHEYRSPANIFGR